VICGNSKFYDYAWLENKLKIGFSTMTYPDLIILGGASGVDYLAERWADNNNVPLAVFSEAWTAPRPNAAHRFSGRPEAVASLVEDHARAEPRTCLRSQDPTQCGPNEWKKAAAKWDSSDRAYPCPHECLSDVSIDSHVKVALLFSHHGLTQ